MDSLKWIHRKRQFDPIQGFAQLDVVGWVSQIFAADASEDLTETTNLGDGLYLFRYGNQQSIFLVGNDGVIATDPLSKEVATVYRAAIAEVTDQPVSHVAYTSSFYDRVPGAQVFVDEGAEVVVEPCNVGLREVGKQGPRKELATMGVT